MLSVRMMGRKRTREALKDAKKRGAFAIEDFTEIIAEKVMAQAIHLMADTPKTGKIWMTERGPHQASAPGEAPAEFTGALIRSMQVTQTKINQYAFSASVGSNLHYAAELEFFGPNYDGKPRPFLQPAVDIVEREVGAALADSWKGAERKVKVVMK